ncbi:hypothetical protein GBF38_011155, partial [Nibea albiflora]
LLCRVDTCVNCHVTRGATVCADSPDSRPSDTGLGNKPRYSRAQVFHYEEHNERVQTWRDRQANGEGLVSESTPVEHLPYPLMTH